MTEHALYAAVGWLQFGLLCTSSAHSQRKKSVTSECAIDPKGICIGCQIYTNTVARGHGNGKTGGTDLTTYSLKLLYEYTMSDFNCLQIVLHQGRPQAEAVRGGASWCMACRSRSTSGGMQQSPMSLPPVSQWLGLPNCPGRTSILAWSK